MQDLIYSRKVFFIVFTGCVHRLCSQVVFTGRIHKSYSQVVFTGRIHKQAKSRD